MWQLYISICRSPHTNVSFFVGGQSSSRKLIQKYCPADKVHMKQRKSDIQKACCKCCQRGNRAARGGNAKCTLKKSYSKQRSFLKTLKECPTRKSKRCYLDCCNSKRKEVQKKLQVKIKTRKNKNKNKKNRSRNRNQKRPVG